MHPWNPNTKSTSPTRELNSAPIDRPGRCTLCLSYRGRLAAGVLEWKFVVLLTFNVNCLLWLVGDCFWRSALYCTLSQWIDKTVSSLSCVGMWSYVLLFLSICKMLILCLNELHISSSLFRPSFRDVILVFLNTTAVTKLQVTVSAGMQSTPGRGKFAIFDLKCRLSQNSMS